MDEKTALQSFFPPWKGRPGKMGWRVGGVMQIHVTRACSRTCRNCTQGSNLGGKTHFMSPEQMEAAVLSLTGYPYIIALFGGQPTLSPYFKEYCEIFRRLIPYERRGIWTNALNGWGEECRKTFNPKTSNLNVHMNQADYAEFRATWPEARPFGLDCDSRHSPVFVAMKDIIPDESTRWSLISQCDIARDWSSLIGLFRGQLRGWICEIMGSQSMLHENDKEHKIDNATCPLFGIEAGVETYQDKGINPKTGEVFLGPPHKVDWSKCTCYSYPDTGIPIGPNGMTDFRIGPTENNTFTIATDYWWKFSVNSFAHQIRKHCHECSVPLKGYGALALDNSAADQISATHASIYKPKRKDHQVEIVTTSEQLGSKLRSFLDYIGNGRRSKGETTVKESVL